MALLAVGGLATLGSVGVSQHQIAIIVITPILLGALWLFLTRTRLGLALRAVAQSMTRELGPHNIHVVHLLIDAGVDSEAIHQRMKAASGVDAKDIPPDSLTKTSSIAEAYWFAHQQSRDGWTHELDLRPAGEKW